MKTFLIFALASLSVASLATAAAPTIGTDAVLSAASYLPSKFPNAGIAQGAIFAVFGSDLGPAAPGKGVAAFPLPTNLAGTSIKVTIGETSVDALILFTRADQVNAILPSNTPVGTGTIAVTFNGDTGPTAPIKVVAHAFGIFALNAQGHGPGVITIGAGFNSVTHVFHPADVATLWGTGLGAITGADNVPPTPGNTFGSMTKIYVGGKLAAIDYAGRTPCCAADDQINFHVPTGVEGCYIPVIVVVNGVVSNTTTMSVAATGNVCSDPNGLSAELLAKIASGTAVNVAFLELARFAVDFEVPILGKLTITSDSGTGSFYHITGVNVATVSSISSLSENGTCVVFNCRGKTCDPLQQIQDVERLDAGPKLMVTGPNGEKDLPGANGKKGDYFATLGGGIPGQPGTTPSYLSPGSYTITGPGGADVGGFTASLTLGQPLVWSNKASVSNPTIPRGQDLLIQWTGGDQQASVVIFGNSTSDAPEVTAAFACTQAVSAGQFSIPSYILSAMPVSGTISQSGLTFPAAQLLVGEFPFSTTFTATGLDKGYVTSTDLNGKNVNFQ